jgi:hypothetical protein
MITMDKFCFDTLLLQVILNIGSTYMGLQLSLNNNHIIFIRNKDLIVSLKFSVCLLNDY